VGLRWCSLYGTHFYGGFRTAIEQAASILQGRDENLLYHLRSPISRAAGIDLLARVRGAGRVRYPGADLRCVEPGRLPFANQSFERWL
jgi:hypothetical protein